MFVFGPRHAWQADESVQQILVFPHHEMKEIFEKDFALRVEKLGLIFASDSNIGAIYKLRAVKARSPKTGFMVWVSIIRCGITGTHLFESSETFDTPDKALYNAFEHMRDMVIESFDKEKLERIQTVLKI